MKILFAGGGTGGHIFPIIAISRELKKINSSINLCFIGPKDKISPKILEKEGIKVKRIFCGKIRRYLEFSSVFLNIIDVLFRVPLGIIQAFVYIFFTAPDLILSKGGYGAVPTIIAGKILRVPIIFHESDIAPGLVTRKFSKYALEIFTSFQETEVLPKNKIISVGNPVRKDLFVPLYSSEVDAIKLKREKPILLILGGSQGSEKINDLIFEIINDLLLTFEIIHQCGVNNYKNILTESDFLVSKGFKESYHLFPFLTEKELRFSYQVSEIIISRAGSGGIFEIASARKPSIIIPITNSAQNHQIKNAQAYSNSGSAIVIEENNLTPRFFLHKIMALMKSTAVKKNMSNQAGRFSKPNSAKIMAEYIIAFLEQ